MGESVEGNRNTIDQTGTFRNVYRAKYSLGNGWLQLLS